MYARVSRNIVKETFHDGKGVASRLERFIARMITIMYIIIVHSIVPSLRAW